MRGVLVLAWQTKAIVVAEGVEDQRQAQILQALGCPLAQGFLFARPMPAQELYSWLGKRPTRRSSGSSVSCRI
ncbi:MAG: hypothetical protein A2580_00075 [Hydrogenophilales bacterium RIFOXYD1_FULL_62_11]|nr:MAG: hypothetical protein A2580_00075 [Hydrogenophilales bacterium RIFOXYD1_FULL_62_11]